MVKANLLALRDAIQERDMRRVRQLMIEHMTDTGMMAVEPIGFEDSASGRVGPGVLEREENNDA
ncbi:MAG: hypothetical protein IPK19_16750 [Chloroflexi bacterium]|nr:hypothetical protein [Chloroflexota bacterium]